MDTYIKNLLPRLKQYGQKLNKIESFVDKTWVIFEQGNSFQTFRFQRSGKLLITVSGNVEEHHWEYLPPDSLYIKRDGTNGKMYRQAFFIDSLFVMQVEGTEFEPVLFYNEAEIPDGDVAAYVFKLYAIKNNLGVLNAERKYFFTKHEDFYTLGKGSKVFDENLVVITNQKIILKDKEITITNGLVSNIDYIHYLDSERGKIKLSSTFLSYDGINKGARVCLENGERLDGKIKILNHPYLLYIIVEDWKIRKIIKQKDYAILAIIIIIIIVIIFSLIKNN